MSILQALILGIVQGITEFVPVSSSGHLVLLQKIFKIDEPAMIFDTMVHVGTLIAVMAVLWREIWDILRKIIQPLTLYLIIATLPAVIFALVFNDFIKNTFDSGFFLGFSFLITAVLLMGAEFFRSKTSKMSKNKDSMNWFDALIIGLFQAVGILPGISRSGATISGALFRRLDRDFAARFSFLLSIPAILGALVFQLKDFAKGGIPESIGAVPIIVGTLSAAITGFFAVKFMLKIIRERSLALFSIYTGVLGVLVLIDQFWIHRFF
jgi:undecaprenyl-diphosphatase